MALTRASLLNAGRDVDYTDQWCALLDVTPAQHRAVRFHTALCCLDFMSELGKRFNRESSTAIDEEALARLGHLLEDHLHDL